MSMTKTEKNDLISLSKQRARVAKQMAEHRALDLLARFEEQLATEYAWDDDETWEEAHRLAEEAVNDANERIGERCRELGIPKQFGPSIEQRWYGRGENMAQKRRAELRKAAETRLREMTQRAKVQIDAAALEVQTYLVSDGLETDDARRFLESGMPTVESLMPTLAIPEIERMLGPGR